jgi:nitrate reductase NapD
MNVSSVVIRTSTERLEEVIENINKSKLCEVHFYDTEGRIVVTMEGENISDQMNNLRLIQGIPFVIDANLVYAYCEDELNDAIGKIEWMRSSVSKN